MRIVTAVAEALDYAHDKGLTHRDVKPANVLIADAGAENERIMLADFGIARRADDTSNLTGTNMTVGTVAYAAPEQLTGEVIDGRADQYALASTAYELLTGSPPFQHSNPAVVISQHLTAKPPPIGSRRPELSSLGGVFDKALAKSPDDRYARCIDFARALANRTGVPVDLAEDAQCHHVGARADHRATPCQGRGRREVASQGGDRRRGVRSPCSRPRRWPSSCSTGTATMRPPSRSPRHRPSPRRLPRRPAGQASHCRWLRSGRTAPRWVPRESPRPGGRHTAHTCPPPMPSSGRSIPARSPVRP